MRNSKPSKSNKSINCKYPMDVFDNICEALVDFGEMLDIDMDEPHTSISSEVLVRVENSPENIASAR